MVFINIDCLILFKAFKNSIQEKQGYENGAKKAVDLEVFKRESIYKQVGPLAAEFGLHSLFAVLFVVSALLFRKNSYINKNSDRYVNELFSIYLYALIPINL